MTEPQATGVWTPPAGVGTDDVPTVPGYIILGELGRGGMGVVYHARQGNPDRAVALKVLRGAAGPEELARFRIEAEAAARVRHPQVVEVYAVGEHQGRPFLALELVAGGSLDRHLAGQPQEARTAAALVRAVARAIAHAHDQGIVHRDLKPANILLTPDGSPKVTDFGLAKRLDAASTAWTLDGAVLGTVGYLAPEQAAGRSRDIGPAVDVWALGAILYECLTGRPPFQADAWPLAVAQVLHDEPTPPSRLRPGVPMDLDTVCLKCLEKEPGRRYASARDLADDLERFLAGQPLLAAPLAAAERLARLAARDGFEIVGEIGRGPRSTVYRALTGPLRQPVALKVFAAGACPRDAWEDRLRRGADVWAALAHPQVITAARAGWWDDAAYVAMEFVPQGSLAAKLGGRPLPLREALDLAGQLAEIVRYLHRQGVTHGNLKPSNVLLASDGIPRVVDFRATGGWFLGPWAEDSADLGYLAPEVAHDPGAEPRPYTDIYGVGTVLYTVLTGRPPFAAATARAALDLVRTAEPEAPSAINPAVPPAVEACCLKCLRKDPWRRYVRAYDLEARLRALQAEVGKT